MIGSLIGSSLVAVLFAMASSAGDDALVPKEIGRGIDCRRGPSLVFSVSDQDGDGVPDVAVGVNSFSDTAGKSGRIYLLSGRTGSTLGDISSVSELGGFGFAGCELTRQGERTIAFSAPAHDSARGRVVVTGLGADIKTATAQSTTSAHEGAWFGVSLLAGDDVSGDGTQEILVGAPSPKGRASVVLLDGASLDPVWRAVDAEEGTLFGYTSCVLDDLNDDGVRDFAVGAPGRDLVVLLSGADGRVLRKLAPPSGCDACRFGESLVFQQADGAGDFLLVGAPGQGKNARAHVYTFDSDYRPAGSIALSEVQGAHEAEGLRLCGVRPYGDHWAVLVALPNGRAAHGPTGLVIEVELATGSTIASYSKTELQLHFPAAFVGADATYLRRDVGGAIIIACMESGRVARVDPGLGLEWISEELR